MAITASGLTSGSDTVNATSFSTASITPGSNRLVLAFVVSRNSAGIPVTPTLSGNGLTWVLVRAASGASTPNKKLSVFRAMGASPTAGAVTIDFAGETQTSCLWIITEYDGVDTSGTDGSGAIVQDGTNFTGGATSLTVTLAAIGNANRMTYGAFYHNANEGTAPGGGYTEIHDVAIAENTSGIQTEYQLGTDNTVSASWTTDTSARAIAAEIKEAAVAGVRQDLAVLGAG